MASVAEYRKILRELKDWDSYLLAESGLPGPRANLSLAEAAADVGDEAHFRHWLANTAENAPSNTPGEFLALCGVVGLGKLLAEGQLDKLATLRSFASDPRWRLREGVAIALQRWGDNDMDALINAIADWSKGNLLEQRATAAALCEPRLLKNAAQVERVLRIVDHITSALISVENRKQDDFIALRKGLGYCWSVAVAANPTIGKPLMEKWFDTADKDIRWIMKENLKKDRLKRMDAAWVERGLAQLE
jgi:hypothetical protein